MEHHPGLASRGCKAIPNESSPGEGEVTCKQAAQPQVFSARLKIAGSLRKHLPALFRKANARKLMNLSLVN